MSKKVLVTGINGQDGSYLAEHCLNRGWQVYGILKRNSIAETQDIRIQHLNDKIHTYYGDMNDLSSLIRILKEVKPDYIFNLAAQSHVRISSDMPIYTGMTNAIGVLNILEAMKLEVPEAHFYQASSSEMFGNSIEKNGFQLLTTPMMPVSPYGIAKLYGFHMTRHYRNGYNLFCSNGILFNHTSPRRGHNFIIPKIISRALEIKYGLKDKLVLGNLDTKRDFGHSKDYTRAMIMILEHNISDDFIIATGESHSIREICEIVFDKIELGDYKKYIIQNSKYMRPEELKELKGDNSKAKKILNWKSEYTFEMIIEEIINYWDKKIYEQKH